MPFVGEIGTYVDVEEGLIEIVLFEHIPTAAERQIERAANRLTIDRLGDVMQPADSFFGQYIIIFHGESIAHDDGIRA